MQIKIQTLALQAKINEKEQLQQASVKQDDAARAQPQVSKKPKSVRDTLLGSDSEEHSNEEDSGQEESGADNERVRNEVLMYFGEQYIARDKSLLNWWKGNAARLPNLAVLAKSYMSVPATSTPSERRASLTSEHVDMLTFLHSNV